MAEVKYGKAVKRLEEIIQKLESETVDVDELTEKVKEAVELIELCKGKIDKAEFEVKRVIERFSENPASR